MPQVRLTPPQTVKKHGRVHHVHNHVKFLTKTAWTCRRINGKLQWTGIGRHCPYCGFSPAEATQRDHANAVMAVLGKRYQENGRWRVNGKPEVYNGGVTYGEKVTGIGPIRFTSDQGKSEC